MSTHDKLLNDAKENQLRTIQQSSIYSNKLVATFDQIIKSCNKQIYEAYSMILQLDKEIRRQLQEISSNFYLLKLVHKKLSALIHKIVIKERFTQECDELQHRVELIDQNLRILENTLKFVQENKNTK